MSQTRERYFEITLLGLILGIGAILFYQATPFINGILGAITLYILLRRVNLYCAKRMSPRSAPWVIVAAVTVFLMIPFSCFAWYVIDLFQSINFDVQPLLTRIQRLIDQLEDKVGMNLVSEDSLRFLTARLSGIAQMLMSGINNFAITLFTSLLLLFFLLSGSVKMERYIARLLPFNESNKHTIIHNVTKIVRSNAIGIPLLAILQGVIATLCYSFVGVENSIEFGLLTGFASLIPIVGTMLVWIPLAVSQYFEVGLVSCLYVLGCGLLVISQCDNVLRMIMQKRMSNTHPLITISGVVVGLPIFGFMGLIFGPLLVAMFLLFLNMFARQYILGEDEFEIRRQLKDDDDNDDDDGDAGSSSLNGNNYPNQTYKVTKTTIGASKTKAGAKQGQQGQKGQQGQSQGQGRTPNPNGAQARTQPAAQSAAQANQRPSQGQNQGPKSASAATAAPTTAAATAQASAPATAPATPAATGAANAARPAIAPAATPALAAPASPATTAAASAAASAAAHAQPRPSISMVDPKKNSKGKKDFKSAKAEHKQQKRQAAKMLAEQEQQRMHQAELQLEAASAQNSPESLQTAAQSAPAVQPAQSAHPSSSSTEHPQPDSSLNLQAPQAPAAPIDPYHQGFAFNQGALQQENGNKRQFAGQSLVSRAVADALKPFHDDKLADLNSNEFRSSLTPDLNKPVSLSPNYEDQGTDMISSESMQTTNNKQTSESTATAPRNEAAHSARNRGQDTGGNKAQRSKKEGGSNEQQPRRLRNKQQHEAKAAGAASSNGNAGSAKNRDKSASKRQDKQVKAQDKHKRNDRHERKASESRNGSKKSGDRKRDSSFKDSRSRSSSKRSSKRTNNLGYEILRPERKKRGEDEPIIQTVVSHQYGGFDPKPRSTLRTQLISVHTAKGTMMANQPHRSGRRRSYR